VRLNEVENENDDAAPSDNDNEAPFPSEGDVAGYRPSTRLRDLVLARMPTCSFPGCQRSARRCDLDHVRSWSQGGPTSVSNLIPLCRRHHRLKHGTPWKVDLAGTIVTWTSPHHRVYRKQPPN
jgi:hypothetical protein